MCRKHYHHYSFKDLIEIFFRTGYWLDLGIGCCANYEQESTKIVNKPVGNLSKCKEECLKNGNCRYVIHGWTAGTSNWCTAFNSAHSCSMPLHRGQGDCGSTGDDGVHTYEFVSGCSL